MCFTPDTDDTYAFTTIGSDYDTSLGVHEGSPGSLSLVGCNDDAFGLQSALAVELTAGTPYYIEAGACCGGPGTLVFNVDHAPDAFEVDVTVDGARIGDAPGTVALTGTVTCNGTGSVNVSGTIRQRQGHVVVRGDFYTDSIACSSTAARWTGTADAGSRIFQRKVAQISVSAGGCNGFTCDDASLTQDIRIRR